MIRLEDKYAQLAFRCKEEQQGFPGAIVFWALDNPVVDHVADVLKLATGKFAAAEKMFAKPANPRPFPPLAPLTGNFVDPTFGKAALRLDGDGLVLALQGSGAELKLEPWDGDVFTVGLVPAGRFAAVAENLGPPPIGFVQFQIDKEGRLGLLPVVWRRAGLRIPPRVAAAMLILQARLISHFGSVPILLQKYFEHFVAQQDHGRKRNSNSKEPTPQFDRYKFLFHTRCRVQFIKLTSCGACSCSTVMPALSKRSGTMTPSGNRACRSTRARQTKPCVTTTSLPFTLRRLLTMKANASATRA